MAMWKKMTLDESLRYEIAVAGLIEADWTDWVDVKITTTTKGSLSISTLEGDFDQAALQGVLRRIYSFGYPLISVNPSGSNPARV